MKQAYSSTTLGAALVAVSALGYSTNPIFGKVAYAAGGNAITLGAARFTIATLLLWALVAVRPQHNRMAWGQRLRLLLLGALGMAMVALMYFSALGFMGASLATGIFYSYPAMATLVGVVRGQGLSRGAVAGLLLTTAGTWMLLSNDLNGFDWIGAALIFLAAAWYTTYLLVSERWTQGYEPVAVSAHVGSGAMLVFLTAALVTGQSFPSTPVILSGAGLALFSTVLAMITFFAGLVKVGTIRASIISTLEPVFTALLAVVVLRESLNFLQFAGIALVMVGAVAAQIKDKSTAATEQA